MAESRWLRWIGPGGVALGAVALDRIDDARGRNPAVGAARLRRTARRRGRRGKAAGTGRARRTCVARRGSGWTRCSTGRVRCAASGSRSGIGGGSVEPTADLPPESFASGPFGGIVLVGSDDGFASRLQAFDVAAGLHLGVATSATSSVGRPWIRPDATIYETRVDRTSRADLGVWQRPLDGGRPRRILDPLPAPTLASGERSRPSSPGTPTATRSRSSRAARSPAGRGSLDPGRLAAASLDGARSRRPRRARRGPRGDLRRLPRAGPARSSPRTLRTGRDARSSPSGGQRSSPRRRGRRLVHETPGRRVGICARCRSTGRRRPTSDPSPTGSAWDSARRARLPRPACPTAGSLLAPDAASADGPALRQQLRRIPDGMAVPLDEAMR